MFEAYFGGNAAMFLAAFVILIVLLASLVKIAYELGVDDGWEQAGRWNDDHAYPLSPDELAERTRPATRDTDA